jgi:hypothetical protein
LIIFYIQPNERTIDLRRYSDEIGKDFGIIGPGIVIRAVKHEEPHYRGYGHDRDTDRPTEKLATSCTPVRVHWSFLLDSPEQNKP